MKESGIKSFQTGSHLKERISKKTWVVMALLNKIG